MEQDKMETDSSQMPDADSVPFNTTQQTLPPVVTSPVQQDVVELMTEKPDMYYSMAHKNRGKAILINMQKFKRDDERVGAPRDLEAMRDAFEYLQFRIVILENKSRNDLMSDLRREAEDENLKYDDCLAVVIMTHGCEGLLLSASDLLFTLDDVKEIFMPNNCKDLVGKPKLFFIQACRGKGVEEAVKALDAKSKDKKRQFYLIPTTCDILEFHSTSEGKIAARDTALGSWFIQSLAKELVAHGFEKSLLSILSLVIRKVAIDCEYQKEEDKVWKQQPVIVSTLSRILKFNRKNQ